MITRRISSGFRPSVLNAKTSRLEIHFPYDTKPGKQNHAADRRAGRGVWQAGSVGMDAFRARRSAPSIISPDTGVPIIGFLRRNGPEIPESFRSFRWRKD